jgi:hypothetical protein
MSKQNVIALENEQEDLLHAIYDAWLSMEQEAQAFRDEKRGVLARAILKDQLERHSYEPYMSRVRPPKIPSD